MKIAVFCCFFLSTLFQIITAFSKPHYVPQGNPDDEGFINAKEAGERVCVTCNVREFHFIIIKSKKKKKKKKNPLLIDVI